MIGNNLRKSEIDRFSFCATNAFSEMGSPQKFYFNPLKVLDKTVKGYRMLRILI